METIPKEDFDLQDKYQNIAKNLSNLLESNHLSATQLAQTLGIPMMTIRRLLLGETKDPRVSTLKLIANYFETTIDSLIEKNYVTANTSGKTRGKIVPKLSWETASKISSLSDIDLNTWKNWISVPLGEKEKISSDAFALESKPSMFPRFPQGTLFVFDSQISPNDGDIVLVKIKKNNELTLRELIIDPPEWQLHGIATATNMLHYSEIEHKIIGINILTMLFNRKDYA